MDAAAVGLCGYVCGASCGWGSPIRGSGKKTRENALLLGEKIAYDG